MTLGARWARRMRLAVVHVRQARAGRQPVTRTGSIRSEWPVLPCDRRRRARHERWWFERVIVRADLQLKLAVRWHIGVSRQSGCPSHVRAARTVVPEGIGLQHFVAVPDGAIYRAVIAQCRRGRDREIRIAVGDRRIVITENVVLQIRVAMRRGHGTRSRLVQS